jgi:hypothetical protein
LRGILENGTAILFGFALIRLLLYLVTNVSGGYGYFRDELYYIACSDHLDLGYVDQPPFSIYVLAVNRLLFGDSIIALRLLPALIGSATVFLVGLMARELGGGRYAMALASAGAFASIVFLAMGSLFSMNCFDILFWTLGSYLLILIIRKGDPRVWLILGFLIGLGLLNKVGMLWFGFGIALGLLLTPQRSWLRTPWPYAAGAIALLVFLPYIIWNLTHDFPHLEFIRNATSLKYSGLSPGTFIVGQLLGQNPVTFPLWLVGLVFLLAGREGRAFRLLAIVYLAALLILIVNGHSKPEYLGPAYGVLFAAGGVAFERAFARGSRAWLKPACLILILAGGIGLAPVVLPILPVETYIRYADALGLSPSTSEGKQLGKLPQLYADMFGWEEKAAAVAKVFHALTPEEQKECAIFATNYGRCGAIDFFGRAYGLPRSIGSHNSYWIWGPRDYTGAMLIRLGGRLEDLQHDFESVVIAGQVTCNSCMPYEDNLSIYLCRNMRRPLGESWPGMKHFE